MKKIYLDQWTISNITKLKLGLLKGEEQELWQSIHEKLIGLVEKKVICCPVPQQQFEESVILKGETRKHIIKEHLKLSNGVFFKPDYEITDLLEEKILHKYLKIPFNITSSDIYFTTDTETLNEINSISSHARVSKYKKETTEILKRIKNNEKTFSEIKKDEESGRKIHYATSGLRNLLRENLPSLIKTCGNIDNLKLFIKSQPSKSVFYSELNDIIEGYENGTYEWNAMVDKITEDKYQKLHTIWKNHKPDERFEIFWDSPNMKNISTGKIACELYGQIGKKGNRIIKPGDMFDIQRLSSALPSCDIVFCDKNFHELCRQLGYEERYSANIFNGTTESLNKFLLFLNDIEANS